MIPSAEQQYIVDTLSDHNITVDAIAGAGKSSTVLFIAEKYKNSHILVLTYNAQLKAETRKRAINSTNLDVHSYHSFCVTNYNPMAYTDDVINTIIQENTQSNSLDGISYDVIIADEAQDITPLFYKLLCKIFVDNIKRETCRLVIMGDQMQSIYKFRESDCRFITMSEKIFNSFNQFQWKSATLSESFRCTIPMVQFINDCMIGYKRMISKKESKFKPDYVICNSYGKYPQKLLKDYLKIYKPQDIFILAYSIKDKTPIKNLANYITNNLDTPIYCSSSDQDSLDSRVIENKLVLTTIHQAKGRERKVVIFFGFDEGYFEYYDTKSNKTLCPNELYVAMTRSSERLSIIHDQKKGYLPFLNIQKLRSCTNFVDESKTQILKKSIVTTADTYTVSELVSYLPFSIEHLCTKYFTVKQLKDTEYKLDIPTIVKMENTAGLSIFESVSDITGIAIPAYFEYSILGNSTLFGKNLIENRIQKLEQDSFENESKLIMITKLKKFSKTLKQFYKNNIETIDIKNLAVSDLLKIALYYSAQQNKTDYKLKQITEFNWLTPFMLNEGIQRMKAEIKSENKLLFEESVDIVYSGNLIIGEIDCIDLTNKIVYEFKCTKDLTVSHMIQLCIYMYIYGMEDYRYRLFNIFTNEIREISSTRENLGEMIKILIEHKLANYVKKTDDEFLEQFKTL